MTKPTIDVLFPYYGNIGMMKKSVASVLAQTYMDWTLRVFDDGYPDPEPARFFHELALKDSRIHYEKNEEKLGANGNYRKALSQAGADFFVMMGADDLMHPDFLARFMACYEEAGPFEIYQPMVDIINEYDEVYLPLADRVKRLIMPKTQGLYEGEDIAKSYISGWHYFPSVIWQTKLAQMVGFNTQYGVVQDVNLGLDMIQRGARFYFDRDHISFSYRRHSQSDSSTKSVEGTRFDEEKQLYDSKQREFRELGWRAAARAAKHHSYSRIHAVTILPKTFKAQKGSTGRLLRHVFNLN